MADSKLSRHQYHHSMFSKEAAAKSLVLIATQGFIYLCSLLLYLEVICGNESFVQPPSLALPCIWGLR